MTATARHFLGFPSYIIYRALKFDFCRYATWRCLVEGLNVRIRGTSNRQNCSEWSVRRGESALRVSELGFEVV